jgi:hypothetical protein
MAPFTRRAAGRAAFAGWLSVVLAGGAVPAERSPLVTVHAQARDAGRPPGRAPTVDFERDVKPILSAKCFGCHGPKQAQSGLRLDLRQNALRGGDYGVVIVPGDAAASKLIQRLTGSSAGLQMPPTGALPPDEIETLRAWIDQGAEMPGSALRGEAVARETDPSVQALLEAIASHDLDTVRKKLTANPGLARAADSSGSSALMHAPTPARPPSCRRCSSPART